MRIASCRKVFVFRLYASCDTLSLLLDSVHEYAIPLWSRPCLCVYTPHAQYLPRGSICHERASDTLSLLLDAIHRAQGILSAIPLWGRPLLLRLYTTCTFSSKRQHMSLASKCLIVPCSRHSPRHSSVGKTLASVSTHHMHRIFQEAASV